MHPILAVDRSMGKLAKWLRLLGYDTIFNPNMPDAQFLAQKNQGRILITRTRSLFNKISPDMVVTITTSDPTAQLAVVVKALDLVLDRSKVFTRCIQCNQKVEPIKKELIADKVPDYIFSTHKNFAICPDCGRIYWPGTHQDRAMAHLQNKTKEY